MSHGEREPRVRPVVLWLVLGGLALLGSGLTLVLFAPTVYSAGAFVERYLGAIAADDFVEVLNTPGVEVPADELESLGLPAHTSMALLRSGVMSEGPSEVRVTGDEPAQDGGRLISVSYELAGTAHTARYLVNPAPALFGMLPRWEFATTPLQLLTVHVRQGTHFTVGGLTLDARAASDGDPGAFSTVGHYLSVAPALLTVQYDSELLAAAPTTTAVLPDVENSLTIDVLPTETLVERVQSKLDEFLDECVTQQVLQPTGCPFGATIDDRVLGDPVWSIVRNPAVSLEPGESGFIMPTTVGVTHLTVPIQSLFDGEKSTFDQDIEYEVGLLVQLRDDNTIAIQLR